MEGWMCVFYLLTHICRQRHRLAQENGIVVWWWKLLLRESCDGEDVTVIVSGYVVCERLFKDVFFTGSTLFEQLHCVSCLSREDVVVGMSEWEVRDMYSVDSVDVGNCQLVVRYVCAYLNADCAVMYIQLVLPIADTRGILWCGVLDGGWWGVPPRM